MAVEVNARGVTFEVGAERALSVTPCAAGPFWTYDVSRNGRRFLVNTPGEIRTTTPLTLVVNWPADLKKH